MTAIPETPPLTVLVSDLKQYSYCPRIVYYRYCLPAIRPTTYKMEQGRAAHETEADRERRRSLRTYGLADGERHFDLSAESVSLGLRGRLDLAICRAEEALPIEYKDSPGRLGRHIHMQLAAYGLLLEELWQRPVQRGFVYFIPTRRARELPLEADLKAEVVTALAAMREMIAREQMPAPPARRAQCAVCEFRRFCNDVI